MCILSRSHLDMVAVNEFDEFLVEGVFNFCIGVVKSSSPIVAMCTYRPPNNSKLSIQTFYRNVDTLLQNNIVKFQNPVLALAGDYTIDFLKDNAINLDLKPVMTTFLQIVFPDHVNILETGLLDHLAQIVQFKHTVTNSCQFPVSIKKRKFTQESIQLFQNKLQSINWTEVLMPTT